MNVKNSINLSMVAISRSIGLEKGPFSKSVDKLESLGLLERVRSATDKRFIHLKLTVQGELLANAVEKSMENHFSEKIKLLSSTELKAFYNALDTLKQTAQVLITR